MSSFENRLWSELACDHGAHLARTARRVRPSRRTSRPRFVIAGVIASVAAAIAITLAATVNSPVPAYAVRVNHDGTVTLKLNALTATSAANERLAKLGIRARIVLRKPGCVVTSKAAALLAPGSLRSNEGKRIDAILLAENAVLRALAQPGAPIRSGALVARIRPDAIPTGDTVVLAVRELGGDHGAMGSHAIGMAAGLYRGPGPSCLPLDGPLK